MKIYKLVSLITCLVIILTVCSGCSLFTTHKMPDSLLGEASSPEKEETVSMKLEVMDEKDEWKELGHDASPFIVDECFEPGHVAVRAVRLTNDGNVDAKWDMTFTTTDSEKLCEVIDLYTSFEAPSDRTLTGADKIGLLADDPKLSGMLTAGESRTIYVCFKMWETAGNEYLQSSSNFDVTLIATEE